MIQPKNTFGCGAASTSRYRRPAAMTVISADMSTYSAVCALPQAPSPEGARIGMLSVHRQTRMPTSAISAATTAVAAAPAQNWVGSGRARLVPAPLGDAGYVMSAPRILDFPGFPGQLPRQARENMAPSEQSMNPFG